MAPTAPSARRPAWPSLLAIPAGGARINAAQINAAHPSLIGRASFAHAPRRTHLAALSALIGPSELAFVWALARRSFVENHFVLLSEFIWLACASGARRTQLPHSRAQSNQLGSFPGGLAGERAGGREGLAGPQSQQAHLGPFVGLTRERAGGWQAGRFT